MNASQLLAYAANLLRLGDLARKILAEAAQQPEGERLVELQRAILMLDEGVAKCIRGAQPIGPGGGGLFAVYRNLAAACAAAHRQLAEAGVDRGETVAQLAGLHDWCLQVVGDLKTGTAKPN